jgi:hypothetical protein
MPTKLDDKAGQPYITVQQEDSKEDVSAKPLVERRSGANPLEFHNRSIIFICCLVIFPMVAFTAVILWMIFFYRVEATDCSVPELCVAPALLNATKFGSGDYIIDFPAAKLVFIASWSSTVSSLLIGCIMLMYGYIAADALLKLSDADSREQIYPNPYEVTLLIRVINADLFVLWDTAANSIKNCFRKGPNANAPRSRMPNVLRTTMMVLLVSVLCRLVISRHSL